MARLFVAVWPTPPVAEALAGIAQPNEAGVRWVSPLNWHITLRFVGDADVDGLTQQLEDATLPAATARLGPRIEQLGPRQAVLPVDGVDALAHAVRAATEAIGEPDPHRFRGHLTIARLKPGSTTSVLGTPFSTVFDIEEVALVSSDLHADGPIYRTLARFPTT